MGVYVLNGHKFLRSIHNCETMEDEIIHSFQKQTKKSMNYIRFGQISCSNILRSTIILLSINKMLLYILLINTKFVEPV